MFRFAGIPTLRRLFGRPRSTGPTGAPVRKSLSRPKAARAHLQVEALEERAVPALTGFRFVEQQGFPGPQATVVSMPTAFRDQLNQTYANLVNGSQLLNGQTLDQMIQDQVRQTAKDQGLIAYNISDSLTTPPGAYSATLDTSQANPTLHFQYYLSSNTLDFTANYYSKDGWPGFMDPSFHVDYSMTINVDVTLPSALSQQATVTSSASTVINGDTVSTHNVLLWLGHIFGDNTTQKIADTIAKNAQSLPNLVPTDTLNALLQGEAAKGYNHLHAGLDNTGNLVLTAQKSNLVINGSANDNIILETGPNNTVKVFAGGQWGTFDSGYLQSITINSGGGNSQIDIEDVPAGVSVGVNGAASSHDQVYVARFGSLTNIAGPVSLTYGNGSGQASLSVNDSYDSATRTVNITNSSVQFSNLPTISWSGGVTYLSIWGGSGTDYYNVRSTPSPLWLVPGAGENHISIGQIPGLQPNRCKSLSGLGGSVTVSGDIYGGKNYLTVDDSADSGRNLTLTDSSVSFTGLPTVYYSGLTELDVVAAAGANTVTVNSAPQNTAVTIYNTASDKVTGPAVWEVTTVGGLPSWDLLSIIFQP
jgi:hypothetical protein